MLFISLPPKVLVAFLFLSIFYNLSTFRKHLDIHKGAPSSLPKQSGSEWFLDVIRTPKVDSKSDEDTASSTDNVTSAALESIKRDYSRIHVSYGEKQCMPQFGPEWRQATIARNASCVHHTPFPANETRRIGFASITTGKTAPAYQRAILSQMFHAAVHDTSIHVLCNELSDGAWNKIAFLLKLVMEEMLKPASTRLEWMMWMDRDAIVLDACRPLSSFVPPNDPAFDQVQLIINEDLTMFNAGVFLFRVSQWMIDFLNTVLAFRYYRPDTSLVLAEQSAMDIIMRADDRKDNFARVPWYWFNAYPDEVDAVTKYKNGLEPSDLEWFRAHKGDFIVHFAGSSTRSKDMVDWEDMLDELGNVWEGKVHRDISSEITEYWQSLKEGRLTAEQMTGRTTMKKEQVTEKKEEKEEVTEKQEDKEEQNTEQQEEQPTEQ